MMRHICKTISKMALVQFVLNKLNQQRAYQLGKLDREPQLPLIFEVHR